MTKPNLAILGLGSRSTTFYINELNSLYKKKNGGYSTFPFLLLNSNFDWINKLLPHVSKELDNTVNYYIKEIEKMDVENLLIPNITLHETIDKLKINKHILHPITLSITKIKQNNWDKIVIFGSLYGMKSTYLKSCFLNNGIKLIHPSENDMEKIDEVRKEIYNETESSEIIENYYSLLKKYTTEHPVLIACTELSIFCPENDKIIDMAQVQLKEAINSTLY